MTNNEYIDAYLTGRLSEAEKQGLHDQMESDPNLKQEFDLQSEIAEGLKVARKAELKARLDSIHVGGHWASNTAMGKLTLAALVVGSGIFYLLNDSNPTQDVKSIEPKEVSESIEELIPQEKSVESTEEPINETEEYTATKEIKKEVPVEEERLVTKEPEINKPTLVEPLEIVNEGDEDIVPSGFKNEDATDISNIDVEVDNSKRKYSFHYQFKEGKLFLYGSFDRGLYEIIEINSAGEKVLYLYYKDKYYNLNKNQVDIASLLEITNDSLKKELEELREK